MLFYSSSYRVYVSAPGAFIPPWVVEANPPAANPPATPPSATPPPPTVHEDHGMVHALCIAQVGVSGRKEIIKASKIIELKKSRWKSWKVEQFEIHVAYITITL